MPWAATAPLPLQLWRDKPAWTISDIRCHSLVPPSQWSGKMIHHYSFHSSSKVYASRITFLSIAYPIFSNLTLLQPKYWFKEPLLPDILRWAPVTECEIMICAFFSGQLQFSMHKYWQLHNISSQVYPESSKLMEKIPVWSAFIFHKPFHRSSHFFTKKSSQRKVTSTPLWRGKIAFPFRMALQWD